MNRYEAVRKGYDSGQTIAIWFPLLPPRIPVPHGCKDYQSEYIDGFIKGFNDKRKQLDEREKTSGSS